MTESDRRRERQREGIARAIEAGDRTRATALASEHLYEFPDDLDLVSRLIVPAGDPASGR